MITNYITDKLPIQKGEKIFMPYTCYPVKKMKKTPYRYVAYSKEWKVKKLEKSLNKMSDMSIQVCNY